MGDSQGFNLPNIDKLHGDMIQISCNQSLERKVLMDYQNIYHTWQERATMDPDILAELSKIEGDEAAIEDRFYRSLEFGTGGLRGVIGAGTNRINLYTVAKATQGLCAYLKATGQQKGVAIAYDSRIKSDLFARTAASVIAANGFAVHLYPRLMPTPALSYAVRHLGTSAGIVITASHNPAKYNGYKVYGADGCQITTKAAEAILAQIDAVDIFDGVAMMPYEKAVSEGKISMIGEGVPEAYLRAVATQSLVGPEVSHSVSIVYTPLNGAGISCVPDCLRQNGFDNIIIPEAQRNPDGNFPTCPYPNPEVQQALEVGLACARENNSDLLLATDPDCDRVGVAVRDGDDYTLITGNQMGVLLLDFICRMRKAQGTLPVRPVAVKTIVTTTMAEKVAQAYGVELIDVLTGFKFIGEQIGQLEAKGEENRFIFGFEESYGYLSGAFVRDKDAVNASLLICEMFIYYREVEKKTLVQALETLYARYGAYSERLESYEFAGASGFETMGRIMASLREAPPSDIDGQKVTSVSDYKRSVTTDAQGHTRPIDLPVSDVIQLLLEGDASLVVRPSGTEPKLKIYLFSRGETRAESDAKVSEMTAYCARWIGGF